MPLRALTALILGSAVITVDGTAATVALPEIGRALGASVAALQWAANAPLLAIAALLIPAGAAGDRFGRRRTMTIGLLIFAGASLSCALASSIAWIIGSRLVQGAGAALVVPGAVAILHALPIGDDERTQLFGRWAGWSGLAIAAGPLIGGGLTDAGSWRMGFLLSASLGVLAAVLLSKVPESAAQVPSRIHVGAVLLLMILLGGLTYGIIAGRAGVWHSPAVVIPALVAGLAFQGLRHGGIYSIIPRELAVSRNCIAANLATAALYFALFGVSFLLAMYTQVELGYSAMWAGISIAPIALLMLLSEYGARLSRRHGSRLLITTGSVTAGLGVLWLAAAPDPVPFWSHIVTGAALLGAGLALAVAPLTHAAVGAIPAQYAGAASSMHHAIVRIAGLIAITIVGTVAAGSGEAFSRDGFRIALVVCAFVLLAPGVLASRCIDDRAPGGLIGQAERGRRLHGDSRRSSMRTVYMITLLLVVVGALNWGLVAIAQFDLVAEVFGLEFGRVSPITAIVYLLVAISGIYQAMIGFRRTPYTSAR